MSSRKILFGVVVFCFMVKLSYANNADSILLTINNKKITKSEFLRIYKKNNENAYDAKAIDDYLNLFINFKLKVIDEESLVKDAYEKMKYEIDVSHILIKVEPDAAPEDTLTAYNKALEIRNRVVSGEDFETVAKATSDDPSIKRNGGHLGYFTVFQFVYPFEQAAYSLGSG